MKQQANEVKPSNSESNSNKTKQLSTSNKSCKRSNMSQMHLLEDRVGAFLDGETETQEGGGTPSSTGTGRQTLHFVQYHTCVQCRAMPVAIHVALFILFASSFVYNIADEIAKRHVVLANWLYLTHWNLNFQVAFCAIELASDLSASFAEKTAALRAKLFHTIVFPFGLFVATFFWAVCLVDDGLVRTKRLDERYEDWYNHVVHTMVVPAVLLQSMATYHKLSGVVESFTITAVCGFIYCCWSVMWGVMFDLWCYELFRTVSAQGFLLMVIVSFVLLCIYQTLGRVLHRAIWVAQY